MTDKQNSSPEIDLLYFFKPVGDMFRRLWAWIGYLFRKVRANRWPLVAIGVVLAVAGFSLRYVIAPSYQTHGIFVSKLLPARYCSILLSDLNKLKGGINLNLLAGKLNVSEEAASHIEGISMKPVRDTFALEAKDTTLSVIEITLILKEMTHLDTIQKGIVNFLENNDYAIKRKDARRRYLLELKESLNIKIQSLDSLKKIVNSSIVPRNEGRGIILGQPIDPVSVYNAEISYQRELFRIDVEMATLDNIEIIQPFLRMNNTNYPRYNWMALKFFVFGMAITGLLILIFGRKPKN